MSKPLLLVVFADALGYEMVSRSATPFLWRTGRNGALLRMPTVLGYTSIGATIMTGVYPDDHRLFTEYRRSNDFSFYDWTGPFIPFLSAAKNGPHPCESFVRRIVDVFSVIRARMNYVPTPNRIPFEQLRNFDISLKRKIFSKNAFGKFPSIFDILRAEGIPASICDKRTFEPDSKTALKLRRIRNDTRVAFVYLADLDAVTHDNGVGSPTCNLYLRRLDGMIQDAVRMLQQRDFDVTLLVFSDHGMINVTGQFDILSNLSMAGLENGRDFITFVDSTMARFWASSFIHGKITNVLRRDVPGCILEKDELDHNHIPKQDAQVFLVHPGWVLSPNYYQGLVKGLKAMHGYHPSTREQDATMIVSRHKSRTKSASMVDVLPTILDLLDIQKPYHCVGSSVLND